MASLPELSAELDAKKTNASNLETDKSSKCKWLMVTLLVHHVATGEAQAAADEDFRAQIAGW